jgi:hypothetical protein
LERVLVVAGVGGSPSEPEPRPLTDGAA